MLGKAPPSIPLEDESRSPATWEMSLSLLLALLGVGAPLSKDFARLARILGQKRMKASCDVSELILRGREKES